MKILALIAALLLLPAAPLAAQSQDDVLHGALLPGWQEDNGNRIIALHLALAPDWKTYWRAPGESGIPPVFDWSGSRNLRAATLHWPSPVVFELNGMQSIGYHDELVLPIELVPQDPSQPVDLKLNVFLGICKDICVPAEIDLAAALDGAGQSDGRIAAALAQRPLTAAEAGVGKVTCQAEPIQDGLHLWARVALPRQGPSETLIFEVDDPAIWVAQSQSMRDGSVLTGGSDLVSAGDQPFLLNRSAVTITVIGQDRSVEIKGCDAS